jgi:quercetin dioxygenase-like cupin family protein
LGFWHRNIDAHEIIFCVKGALKWETEMGVKIMHPGDMLVIPKGIGHRSMLCEDSTDENVLIELKIADELTYVGESGNPAPAPKTERKKRAVRSTRAAR